MALATRAKNDFPDTVYFDDWFARVSVEELVGKTVYIIPSCITLDTDKLVRKKLKEKGVIIMTKKDFNAAKADYIAVPIGWMKTRKNGITPEEKKAMAQWKKSGAPLRLYWDHIRKEIGS